MKERERLRDGKRVRACVCVHQRMGEKESESKRKKLRNVKDKRGNGNLFGNKKFHEDPGQ